MLFGIGLGVAISRGYGRARRRARGLEEDLGSGVAPDRIGRLWASLRNSIHGTRAAMLR